MASTWQIRCDTGFSAVARPAGSPGEPPTNPRLRFAAPGATCWTPAPRAQTYSPSNVETPGRGLPRRRRFLSGFARGFLYDLSVLRHLGWSRDMLRIG